MENTLVSAVAVFVGSGLGGTCRWLLSQRIQSFVHSTAFPFGTLAVNMLGCFLIGMLYGVINRGGILNPQLRLMLTVGFCGGFTTFSTFINENYLLFSGSATEVMTAVGYMIVSVAVGFCFLYLGHLVTD